MFGLDDYDYEPGVLARIIRAEEDRLGLEPYTWSATIDEPEDLPDDLQDAARRMAESAGRTMWEVIESVTTEDEP